MLGSEEESELHLQHPTALDGERNMHFTAENRSANNKSFANSAVKKLPGNCANFAFWAAILLER